MLSNASITPVAQHETRFWLLINYSTSLDQSSLFLLFIYNIMKNETSDSQDVKEEEDEVEQQNLISTIKRMHKFYPVFKAINKPPL
jgi:hypothetical protein